MNQDKICLSYRMQKLHLGLVSVIIPIYNVAPYLRECLDSVINQTYTNLEIILVNDGSTDESESIAREYLGDSRVKLISQENKGLSGARNTGLQVASGDFIYFVDSDDYLSLKYIEEMVGMACKFGVEITLNKAVKYFGGDENQKVRKRLPRLYHPNTCNVRLGGMIWRFLFRRDFLQSCGVRFLEGKIYEDEAFLYMVVPLCKAFVIYGGEAYYYRQRKGSIMANHKKSKSYDLLDVFEAIFVFYQERGLMGQFYPPYCFLYESGMDYDNEAGYLQKAKALAQKLNITKAPPPYKVGIEALLQDRLSEPKVWRQIRLEYKRWKWKQRIRRVFDAGKGMFELCKRFWKNHL